ncbi:MAG TPA: glycosyltransferase family 2 protein [Candidatus Saccharimonadales bacterium]|nr:glycosyltransferase family 2 protein [Candidatus Saccharimonadales bacterium]
MKDLEIPYEADRTRRYRFFEILPGALSWLLLLAPFILSFINVTVAAGFILAYVLIFFTRSAAVNVRVLAGYHHIRQHAKIDWNILCADVEAGRAVDSSSQHPKWHYENLLRVESKKDRIRPSELIHAVIIATYNESREILEPTIESVINSDYDVKHRVIFVLAYEERGGKNIEQQSLALIAKYKDKFRYAMAVKHPDKVPGEVIGKGSNITYAGRKLQEYVEAQHLDPLKVVVTTLDSDNRPDKRYLSALSYLYCVSPDPLRASYQPLEMFTNNIWDAPAPMRVIATGNNITYIMLTQRPHLERNFSAHAQCLKALIDMNFWSMRTVAEDGHHFWRSYFHFNGDYRVYPLTVPIYQDAVLAATYRKTIRAQFLQLRRWTYGASDVAYMANQIWFKDSRNVPKLDAITKLMRLLEGHVNWAAGALLLTFAAFVPGLFTQYNYAAYELPVIISRIQTVGVLGALATLFVAIKTLPPRPARYKRHRSLFMLLQWVYLPITTIAFGSLAALNSQTRLIFGWYLTKFDVTDKAIKK